MIIRKMAVTDLNQGFYHINRLVPWSRHGLLQVNENVDIGGDSNPYFHFFETQKKTYGVTTREGKVIQVPGAKFMASASKGEISSSEIPNIAHDLVQHLIAYLRELIWEDIRSREFPHLPSRQRCIWLIPSLEGVKYWINRMSVTGNFQVVRVRVQGRLHRASETYLLGDSEPMTETIKKARQYWLGVVEDSATEEIIFEGRMHIEEISLPQSYA